jgi:putative glutamine amidotransferase
MTPRIAIPIPTSADLDYNQRSWPQYAEAVRRSGGEAVPFELTLGATALRELTATVQGICLPGSPADVDTARYGVDREAATAPADAAREAVDIALLEDALRSGKPLLGICFGVQSMNVWRGGSLVQDLTPLPVNHSAGREVAIAHTVLVARDSLLGSLVDLEECVASPAGVMADQFLRLPVNTSHHQSVSAPGDGLRVVARCPDDGVVEAVELDSAVGKVFHVEHSAAGRSTFLLGVQWHPERSFEISATSRNLFAKLVNEAAETAAGS